MAHKHIQLLKRNKYKGGNQKEKKDFMRGERPGRIKNNYLFDFFIQFQYILTRTQPFNLKKV